MRIFTLKKRKDFIKAAQEFKSVRNGLVLQAAFNMSPMAEDCCYLGYTATKKIGKAHLRNRTKRRLRAAARIVFSQKALSGINYVLIGRHNTATLDFPYLLRCMDEALEEINAQLIEKGAYNDKKAADSVD